MGTVVNQYLMFGIRLDYKEANRLITQTHGDAAEDIQDKYEDNGYKKEIIHFEGVTLISDGMDGEYAFFGIVRQKARLDGWINSVSIERAKAKDIRLVQEKAKALFGESFICTPGWHVVTHWH